MIRSVDDLRLDARKYEYPISAHCEIAEFGIVIMEAPDVAKMQQLTIKSIQTRLELIEVQEGMDAGAFLAFVDFQWKYWNRFYIHFGGMPSVSREVLRRMRLVPLTI